jgi:RNA polymerase sigma factor (sigma-70 family)
MEALAEAPRPDACPGVVIPEWEEVHAELRGYVRCLSSRYYLPGAERADLEQEIWLRIWQALLDNYDGRIPWAAFGRMVAKRTVYTVILKATRERRYPLALSLDAMVRPGDGEFSRVPENLSFKERAFDGDEDETADWLDRAALSPFERQIFEECGLGRRHYRDLAAELGRRKKHVDNALQRARRKLAALALEERPELASRVRPKRGRVAVRLGYSQLHLFPGAYEMERVPATKPGSRLHRATESGPGGGREVLIDPARIRRVRVQGVEIVIGGKANGGNGDGLHRGT